MKELIDLNRYLHDFASAMWVCGCIVMWLLCREAARAEPARDALLRVARALRLATLPSLLVALASGGVRAATFTSHEHVGDLTGATIAILIVKHIFFTAVVGWGLVIHWKVRAAQHAAPHGS